MPLFNLGLKTVSKGPFLIPGRRQGYTLTSRLVQKKQISVSILPVQLKGSILILKRQYATGNL